MKRIVFGLICCFFLALPAVSFGTTGLYGSMNAGVTLATDSDVTFSDGSPTEELEFDAGYTVGGALGYMVENWRIDGEISFQENDIDSVSGFPAASGQDVSLLTFLANGYLDFAMENAITPYLTAGIGASKVEVNGAGGSDDDTVFAYQLGAGVGLAVNETVTWDFRYRYLGTADPEFTDSGITAEAEVASHNFTVGLRMAF